MGLKPKAIEEHIPGNFGFTPPSELPNNASNERTASENTATEVKVGEKENLGYLTFSLHSLLDNLKSRFYGEKTFGECSEEVLKRDEERQKQYDVKTVKNSLENPLGEGAPVRGSVHTLFASDFHISTQPESARTYAIRDQGSWGYKLISWIEKGMYMVKEVFKGSELREQGFTTLMEILPAVMKTDKDGLDELKEKSHDEVKDPILFKWAWNRAIILREKLNSEDLAQIDKDEFEKIVDEAQNQKVDFTKWVESKMWLARNSIVQTFLPKLFEKHLNTVPEDAISLFIEGGDIAHDGGVMKDHEIGREMLYKIIGSTKSSKKFLAGLGGNHEQDAREIKALREVIKFYGHRVFYQEVKPEVEGGKENLIVSLNTFIMSEEWGKVLNEYLEKKDRGFSEELKNELLEMKKEMENAQQKAIEKMVNYEGDAIVIYAHNSRRLLEYLERKELKFKKKPRVVVITGHSHDEENFRFLADKPIVEGNERQHMEIYKSSAFVKFDGNEIRLPKGLRIVIDKEGNLKITNIAFTQDQKDTFEKALKGIKVR